MNELYLNKAKLYNKIDMIRTELNFSKFYPPFDCIKFCHLQKQLEIEEIPLKTKGFCGMLFLGNKVNTIVLNSNRTKLEQNFDCSHEMCHWFLHRNLGQDNFKCLENIDQDNYIEWQANDGAAEFLLPYKIFIPHFCASYYELKARYAIGNYQTFLLNLVIPMSQFYRVTPAVVEIRIKSLKYEIHQFQENRNINNIKLLSLAEQQKQGIRIESIVDRIKRNSTDSRGLIPIRKIMFNF